MARSLVEFAASLPRTGLSTSYLMGFAGIVISVCGALLTLSMCSLCYTRRQVRDKPSSSDGDVSPPKQGASAPCKNSSYSLNNVSAEGKEGQVFSSAEQQQAKSPHVWQRTILMGERCQRPTFSGLILYDEKGNPLPRCLSVLGQVKM